MAISVGSGMTVSSSFAPNTEVASRAGRADDVGDRPGARSATLT